MGTILGIAGRYHGHGSKFGFRKVSSKGGRRVAGSRQAGDARKDARWKQQIGRRGDMLESGEGMMWKR
jgi:hypothetical protein